MGRWEEKGKDFAVEVGFSFLEGDNRTFAKLRGWGGVTVGAGEKGEEWGLEEL